ncbi:hypothetical protein HED60_18020 [Planctomycetales bacterium ZRK34]|nr:hypothetical protein HED60_18020 [Planctomycetales bacterium ZRK34]
MNIAFDIDDTITRHPVFFALVSQALVQAGHRVLILTFRDEHYRETTEADLHTWGITYDQLICWSMETCDLADIDTWKAEECRRHGVDVFFEDDPDVLARVDAATVCFMPFGSVSKSQKWNLTTARR